MHIIRFVLKIVRKVEFAKGFEEPGSFDSNNHLFSSADEEPGNKTDGGRDSDTVVNSEVKVESAIEPT